ncbi:MAG: hypothetical protein IV108_09930 [Burkholderiales bacterium]|nr:hypothetical protein [Burkholderiales bacterium]
MKLSIRTVSAMAALIALIAAGLSYWAGEQIIMAGKGGGDAREATFKSYRITQSLKSLAAGYELTMNEFYSTVLAFPAYQKKSAAQRIAIERELAALATLQEGGAATVAELTRLYKEMDSFRLGLESAMTSADKDWDRAREALFKMNVLSTQAIHQADSLGQSASERATALDMHWQTYQSHSLLLLRITTALALLAGSMLLFGALRLGRAPA